MALTLALALVLTLALTLAPSILTQTAILVAFIVGCRVPQSKYRPHLEALSPGSAR